jgi:hypothetical protein
LESNSADVICFRFFPHIAETFRLYFQAEQQSTTMTWGVTPSKPNQKQVNSISCQVPEGQKAAMGDKPQNPYASCKTYVSAGKDIFSRMA